MSYEKRLFAVGLLFCLFFYTLIYISVRSEKAEEAEEYGSSKEPLCYLNN